MARIVIAGASEVSRAQLARLLTASGLSVFRQCASASELRRTLNASDDGVIVIAGTAPGFFPDELAGDFGDSFQILLIARPEALDACESPRIFKLAYPCAGSVVIGAVEMLSQLHGMQMPKRSDEDRTLVERAKAKLMAESDLSEAEAHRQMQRHAMRNNMKLTEYAREILGNTEAHHV